MKLLFPTKIRKIHQSTLNTQWGDMDALGHVNNIMYFRYFETARVNWLKSIGINLGADNESFVLANACCEFIIPIKQPAIISVDTFLSSIGNTSVDLTHELYLECENNVRKLSARGTATIVWVSLTKSKSKTLPIRIKKLLSAI
jgi:acyl-CoA thioester hydrolase|tara:strand:- start:255 stop:686 length:432 start_codon:yes stop_codon:yes gene_type:complete